MDRKQQDNAPTQPAYTVVKHKCDHWLGSVLARLAEEWADVRDGLRRSAGEAGPRFAA